MASLNKVICIGNLTKDPELKFIPSGAAVCNFRIACNRKFTTNGEKKEEVVFVPIVTWQKTAENCGEYLKKGSSVCVEGRLQSREWETAEGQKRSVLEVCAESVQFLDKKATPGSEPDIPF